MAKRGCKPGSNHAGNFKPGQSGNPGGRPVFKFASWIREQTQEGKELAEIALYIARNNEEDRVKLEAVGWLADRGWGRPVQSVDHNVTETGRMVLIFPGPEIANAQIEQKEENADNG